MKAKTIKRLISCLLVGVTAFSALFASACKDDETSSAAPQALGYTDVDLVVDNSSEYSIVIPENAGEALTFAASELTTFFEIATGYTLETTTDAGMFYNEAQKVISIGDTTVWQGANIRLSIDEYGKDGTFITRKGSQVFLNGAEEHGALNAVYDFLTAQFHYEAFSFDEIYIDKVDDLKLLDFQNATNIPVIHTRTSSSACLSGNEVYATRLRTCLGGTGRRYGDVDAEYVGSAHSMQYILPYDTYAEEHEDWYSTTGKQVCFPKYFTDPEFKTTFLNKIKENILNKPNGTAYQLGMNDSTAVHDRPETKAWTEERGGYGGALLAFANAVARDITAWLTEIGDPRAETFRFSILAYIAYEAAPVKLKAGTGAGTDKPAEYEAAHPDVIAEDNVSVMLCPYYAQNAYAMDDAAHNNRYSTLLEQWSVVADNLEIWFYSTNFRNYMVPYNNFQSYRENCLAWEKYNVRYVYENGGAAVKPFQNLKNYVYAKLMWDPHQDYNTLVDEFIYYYYKEAAPYIREYYDLIRVNYAVVEQQLAAKGDKLDSGMYETEQQTGTTVFSLGYTKQINAVMDKALAAAEKIQDPERRDAVLFRVKREALSPRYFMMQLHASSIAKEDATRYIDEFEEWAAEVGCTQLSESIARAGTPTTAVAEWRSKLGLVG